MSKINFFLKASIIFIFLMSCNETEHSAKNDNEYQTIPNENVIGREVMDSLLNEALVKGNCEAYTKLFSPYFWKYRHTEILYYSLIMANKYKCPEASYNIYLTLTLGKNDSINIKRLDTNTRKMALYYLLQSYEDGYDNAKHSSMELYGTKNKIPKSSDFLEFK